MNSIYLVSQLITYFRKIEKQTSRTTWVQWREIIQEIYREKFFQSKIKLVINSGTADSSKIKSAQDFSNTIVKLGDNEQKEIVELLHLYLELLKNDKDIILAKKFEVLLKEIISITGFQNLELIHETVKKWINDKEEDKFYFKIKLEGTIRIILLDFLVRVVSLWHYKVYNLNQEDEKSYLFFIFSQHSLVQPCPRHPRHLLWCHDLLFPAVRTRPSRGH